MYSSQDILRLVTAPALGCTEPAAIALSAAAAASLLPAGEKIRRMEVTLDPNLYKNALGVLIPGSGGRAGIELAAAMGAAGGDPTKGLEVLTSVDAGGLERAEVLLSGKQVSARIDETCDGLYIHTRIDGTDATAEATVSGMHDRISSLALDGQEQTTHPFLASGADAGEQLDRLERWLRDRRISELVAIALDLDEEAEALIRRGIDYNMALADYGFRHGGGLGVGRGLERAVGEGILSDDLFTAARKTAAAASDARMSGAPLPAMSSSGSGNHGITATNIIAAAARRLGSPDRVLLEAVSIAHVLTAYIKAHTGRLSALCGTAVAAGAGAAAGFMHLRGGDEEALQAAVVHVIEDLAGIICDGAKASCALKVATAAGSAVQAGLLAGSGLWPAAGEGIVSGEAEQTVRNLGRLSKPGMVETDRTILAIMQEEQHRRRGTASTAR
ncbi:MAG: L-serine ammonia-lyase, iron-sulfur-dependent, subunit alpha [Spirochaetaceae bacterium]